MLNNAIIHYAPEIVNTENLRLFPENLLLKCIISQIYSLRFL
jgi:hypothetical protein